MTTDTAVTDADRWAQLRQLQDEATPGPWRWGGQIGKSSSIVLMTVGRGGLTVMETQRLGMQGAEFVFWCRTPEDHWGWNGEREPANQVAVREVPYRTDVVDINNPNARLLVAARNALPDLLAERDALAAEVERLRAAIAAAPAPEEGADLVLSQGARDWLAHGEQGMSSRAMFNRLVLGVAAGIDRPYDVDDFQRCERLRRQVPEVRERLAQMAGVSPWWTELVAVWEQLVDAVDREFPGVLEGGWRTCRARPERGATCESDAILAAAVDRADARVKAVDDAR